MRVETSAVQSEEETLVSLINQLVCLLTPLLTAVEQHRVNAAASVSEEQMVKYI